MSEIIEILTIGEEEEPAEKKEVIINNTKKQEVAKVKEQNERAVEIRLPPVETAQTMNQPAETEEQLAATEREARESRDIYLDTALPAFSKHAENQLKAQNAKNARKKRTSAKLTGEREEGQRDQNEIQLENFTPDEEDRKGVTNVNIDHILLQTITDSMEEIDNNLTSTDKLKLNQLTTTQKQERSTTTMWQVLLNLAKRYSNTENELVEAYGKRIREIINDIVEKDNTKETDMDDHDHIAVNELDRLDDVKLKELNNPQPTSGFRSNASSKPPPPPTKSAPSKIKEVQQPQTSPTKIPTNGSGVTEPTTTSGTKPNTTTPLPSTNDDASNDTSSIEDNDKLMYVNIVFMEDSEEGQQEEENYPPPPKTPTPAEQTFCPP